MSAAPTPGNIAAAPDPAPAGHNNPPPYDPEVIASFNRIIDEWSDAGGQWLDLGEITTEAQSNHLTDFISGGRKIAKQVEDARKAAKEPHDTAAKAVQAAFAHPEETIDRLIKAALALQAPFLAKEQRRKEEEQRRAREEARRREEEAAAARAAAEARNDTAGIVAAEQAQKEAEKAAKVASREVKAQGKSASGGGRTTSLVTVRRAEIVSINALFMHYRDRPEVSDLLTRLATADVRDKDVDETKIPGIRVIEEKVAR
ncbi:hypothetical protein [Maritimibacter sp. DP1N21-5]|uniref:hypothetical protein n=1 Tax=Maritimibacter sp. DP1N21-5 TaxID=2836867 RepID=UPI001C452BAE|nr:hypothetical protein [Maritimibacter sp. DP1N21-5]MBV7408734.1 hypothetical protein [Maritimibacter sp. DP1N21-5]